MNRFAGRQNVMPSDSVPTEENPRLSPFRYTMPPRGTI